MMESKSTKKGPNVWLEKEEFRPGEIRAWWNNQAKANPDQAGCLPVFGDDGISAIYRRVAEWDHFRRVVSLQKSMRVLELGCGAGRWSLLISKHVAKVVAVDFSEEMINIAKAKATSQSINNIEFHVAPAQVFHGIEKFDLIYFSGVDQYLSDEDLDKTIANSRKMLATGGNIIDRVTLSTSGSFYCNLENGYKCLYRGLEDLRSLFAKHGFTICYHAPASAKMRLGRFLRGKRTEAFFDRFPAISAGTLLRISRALDRFRPPPKASRDRSHDFILLKAT